MSDEATLVLATKPSAKLADDGPPALQDLPGNPVPDGVQTAWLMTEDGVRLRTARWASPVRPSKGTVILLSGRTESIEEYFETVGDLLARGFGVLAFDWRGQGGSARILRGRNRGHIENFDQYLTDLGAVIEDVALPDCRPPHYILAHSLGALIALRAAPALSNRIRRMVLCAPLLELNNLPLSQTAMQRIFGAITLFGFGRMAIGSVPGPTDQKFVGNRLTSDHRRFERNRQVFLTDPGLQTGPPTAAFLYAVCRAMRDIQTADHINSIALPTLMLLPSRDEVVRTEVSESYANTMRTGGFLTIRGARHELLQERDGIREEVWAAFDAFVPGAD
jgi:lysophospholipase